MTIQEFVMTAEAFETFLRERPNDDRRFELIHGTVVEKMSPTQEHGFVALNIGAELRNHAKNTAIGSASVETAHKSQDDDYNYRIPDVSFVTEGELVKQGAVPRMPALAVEIKSPDDTFAELREKANYYLTHGAKLVWLVFPGKQRVEVHAAGQAVVTLEADDTLTGGNVLTGFAITVRELFA